MWLTYIALGGIALLGVIVLLDRLTSWLTFQSVRVEDLSPAERNLVTRQQDLDALELDLAIAEDLGVDAPTLNAMSGKVELARHQVEIAHVMLTSADTAPEAALVEMTPAVATPEPDTELVPLTLAQLDRLPRPEVRPALGSSEQN